MIKPQVDEVRSFNRFYTQQIGVLREGLLASPFSLTEVRVLFEIAHREEASASEIGEDLGLDAGYLSRLLQGFRKKGLVDRQVSKSDGRRSLLSLTAKGRKEFAILNRRSSDEVREKLKKLSEGERAELIRSMRTIRKILGAEKKEAGYVLRPHQPGDMGWIVHRHGVLYAQEYGWDESFEALVAGIVAKFIENFDSARERCWIAEKDGRIAGSVFLVKESRTVAKLRLLLVEPEARGLGIGAKLVDECIRFAKQKGYRKIVLWTNHVLHSARRIYEAAGFRLVHEEKHRSFGHDLVGQTFELDLP